MVDWPMILGYISWMSACIIPGIIDYHKTGEKFGLIFGAIVAGLPFLPGLIVIIFRRIRR